MVSLPKQVDFIMLMVDKKHRHAVIACVICPCRAAADCAAGGAAATRNASDGGMQGQFQGIRF